MRKVLFLFGQLNDDDVEWMLRAGRKRALRDGEVLIEQGVPVADIYILLDGHLAVWLKPRRGPEKEIAKLNAGEIVGEMSFVDARPPSATVKAVEDSTVFGISKTVLSAKLQSDPWFAARFYRALAIFLSTTVRERHRALGYGAEGDFEEEDEGDELDPNVMDGIYIAGERFDRMVKRVMVS